MVRTSLRANFVGERAGSVKIGFAEQLNLIDLEGG